MLSLDTTGQETLDFWNNFKLLETQRLLQKLKQQLLVNDGLGYINPDANNGANDPAPISTNPLGIKVKLLGFDMRKFCVADSEAQAKSDVENQRDNVFKSWKEARLFMSKTSPNPPTRGIYCYVNGYLGIWSHDTTNQYVIGSSPQEALEAFLIQSPYSTYPTYVQAQERLEELFKYHYGTDFTVYEICAKDPDWSETKDYYFMMTPKLRLSALLSPPCRPTKP